VFTSHHLWRNLSIVFDLYLFHETEIRSVQHSEDGESLQFILVLGVTMYGLCQYNKTELAWIFLIFPVIYIMLQNILLYVHVSSALQNAPQEQPQMSASYGSGMQAPLLSGQGPSLPQISMPEVPPPAPTQPQQEFTLPKMTNQSNSMGGGFGMGGNDAPSGYSF